MRVVPGVTLSSMTWPGLSLLRPLFPSFCPIFHFSGSGCSFPSTHPTVPPRHLLNISLCVSRETSATVMESPTTNRTCKFYL